MVIKTNWQSFKNPAQKRFRRKLRSQQKRKSRNRAESGGKAANKEASLSSTGISVRRGRKYIDIEVPEELTLYRAYETTVDFFHEVRRAALSQRKMVRLIFEKTRFIGPAALMCLLAEMYRCRNIEPRAARLTGTYPSDKKINQMLQVTGFYKLLDVKEKQPNVPPRYPMEYVPFRTGTQAIGEVAEELEQSLFGSANSINPQASQKLYRGLTEAMTNVVQHAYLEETTRNLPKLRNRWWLLGSVNKLRKEFTALLYDQGVGIPKTVPKNYNMDAVRGVLSLLSAVEPSDGQYIQAAMAIGKSKTKEPHRGKGLHDLRGLIDQCGAGSLRILSRRGDYEYRVGGGESVQNNRQSLRGTLIQWRVPLSAITNLQAMESK